MITGEYWENIEDISNNEEKITDPPEQPTAVSDYSDEQLKATTALTTWIILFILRMQGKYYIPDNTINELLHFMSLVFKNMASYSSFNSLLSSNFLTSIYTVQKTTTGRPSQKIVSYLVCPDPDCFAIHYHSECSVTQGNCKCSSNQFPRHPVKRFREPCHLSLVKSVYLVSGKQIYYPLKVYCYYTLKEYLQQMLLRPVFFDLCRHWVNDQCILYIN